MRATPAPASKHVLLVAALLPPLAQSPGLTSGFGEYREGRFHAGIDYSTDQVTGKPVRAVDDGWVERVRASGVGYGRALYLRLPDGRTAVHGHLARFAPAVAEWVAQVQDSSGSYEQDLVPPPGRFAFRRGDVIAWTGESGAGPPHLHFELRRGDMNLHPLRQGLAVPDATPPSVTAVTILPAGPHGRVGGGIDAWRGTFGQDGEVEAPPVTGPFRLALDTWDRPGERPNRVGTYRLRAALDGVPAFEAVLDSVSWDAMAIADRVYDLAATQLGMNGRRLLQATPGDASGIVRLGVPVWSLTPGAHRIEFVAEDEAGNATRRALRVVVADAVSPAPAPRPRLLAGARPGQPAVLVRDLAVFVAARGGDARPMLVDATGLTLVDSLAVEGGTLWSLALTGGSAGGHPRIVRARGGGEGVVLDEDIALAWDSLAFHEPVALLARLDPIAGPQDDGLAVVSPRSLTIEPGDLALAKAIRIRWHASEAKGRPGVGLFRHAGGRGWSLVAAAESSGAVAATTRRLGTFALLADTTPPRLVAPARWSAKAGAVPAAFSARLSDGGSGLVASQQRVLLDGRRVPAEYDVEAGRLTWRPRAPLAPGAHEIVVEAVDGLGNRSSVRVPVAVR